LGKFIFKTFYVLFPEIWGFQCGSESKLLNSALFPKNKHGSLLICRRNVWRTNHVE